MVKDWNLINPKNNEKIFFSKYLLKTKSNSNLSEMELYDYNNYDFEKIDFRGIFLACQNSIVK